MNKETCTWQLWPGRERICEGEGYVLVAHGLTNLWCFCRGGAKKLLSASYGGAVTYGALCFTMHTRVRWPSRKWRNCENFQRTSQNAVLALSCLWAKVHLILHTTQLRIAFPLSVSPFMRKIFALYVVAMLS